jgi:hypothetical protein
MMLLGLVRTSQKCSVHFRICCSLFVISWFVLPFTDGLFLLNVILEKIHVTPYSSRLSFFLAVVSTFAAGLWW